MFAHLNFWVDSNRGNSLLNHISSKLFLVNVIKYVFAKWNYRRYALNKGALQNWVISCSDWGVGDAQWFQVVRWSCLITEWFSSDRHFLVRADLGEHIVELKIWDMRRRDQGCRWWLAIGRRWRSWRSLILFSWLDCLRWGTYGLWAILLVYRDNTVSICLRQLSTPSSRRKLCDAWRN